MKDLYSLLKEEMDQANSELNDLFDKINKMPDGYLSKIERNNSKYIYLKKRSGNTIKSTYIGKDGSIEHKELILAISERDYLKQTAKIIEESISEYVDAINYYKKKHQKYSDNYYYTIAAAKDSKYNAKHWYRYLAKIITKDKIKLSAYEIDMLMDSNELTNYQKATLRVGTTIGSSVYNEIIKMNNRSSFNNLKKAMEELEIDQLPSLAK